MAAPTQMVGLQIIGDDRGVAAMLGRLEMALEPASIAAFLGARVDPILKKRAKDRFRSEGDDVSGKWEPLASSTQSIRASQGYGPAHPINIRTGQMEAYITGFRPDITIEPGLGARLDFPGGSPSESVTDKIRVAQQGDARTPRRPVLGVNERDLELVMVALAFHIADGGSR